MRGGGVRHSAVGKDARIWYGDTARSVVQLCSGVQGAAAAGLRLLLVKTNSCRFYAGSPAGCCYAHGLLLSVACLTYKSSHSC
jgi:hypothetical protein